MKKYSLAIAILFLFTGCFSTLPPKINEVYLSEKSDADNGKLEGIEKSIIKITDDKAKIEKEVKIIALDITIAKKERNRHEANEELLNEKQKLNILKKDTAGIQETKQKIAASKKAQVDTGKRIKYLKAKEDNLEKQVDVKESELAVKVAEQLLVKAKIARANQEKMMKGADEKQKKNLIDVSQYQKYYDSQKGSLDRAEKSLRDSDKELKKAESNK